MSRVYGTVSMGLRAPIVRQGDNLVDIVTGSVVEAMKVEGLTPRDRDVVCMTEAIVARAQGNYASVDQIAADVKNKFGGDTVGVIFPILSRNRFAICLRGIAKGCKKVVLMLSFPSDEVGNHLVDLDLLDEKGINPYTDVLTEAQWRELFGTPKHTFTGVDYALVVHLLCLPNLLHFVFGNSNRTDVVFQPAVHSSFDIRIHIGGELAGIRCVAVTSNCFNQCYRPFADQLVYDRVGVGGIVLSIIPIEQAMETPGTFGCQLSDQFSGLLIKLMYSLHIVWIVPVLFDQFLVGHKLTP